MVKEDEHEGGASPVSSRMSPVRLRDDGPRRSSTAGAPQLLQLLQLAPLAACADVDDPVVAVDDDVMLALNAGSLHMASAAARPATMGASPDSDAFWAAVVSAFSFCTCSALWW